MKPKYLLILLTPWVMGCNDFLEESSQDEVRPSTLEDLMQVMVGEAYPMTKYLTNYVDLLTDDMKCNGISGEDRLVSGIENNRPVFSWSPDMFEEGASMSGINSWQLLYGKIMGCNVVLDYLDRVAGNNIRRENMRGQALILRGYYYLYLVNLFALPYNVGDPEENPGVPLKLTMGVTDDFLPRNTVAEVYRQIESDLTEGVKLLEENNLEMPLEKISPIAGKAILTRLYLYMENWDQVLEYANQVLAVKPTLVSLASFKDLGKQSHEGLYIAPNNGEVIWQYSGIGEYGTFYPSGVNCLPPYSVSDELLGLYERSENAQNYLDLRARLFFYHEGFFDMTTFGIVMCPKFGWKGGFVNSKQVGKGIRTAEVYLNRVEANIRKYMKSGDESDRKAALADLNLIRSNRYDTRNAEYTPVDYTNASELFDFYKEERRRELNFEEHRWFDLRRMGMPRIEHVYFTDPANPQVFVLEENSPRYVLPIPKSAIERNPALVQNP